jgi:hypothetical protein
MAVIQMSKWELTRLSVLIDLANKRLTVAAAGTLIDSGSHYRGRTSSASCNVYEGRRVHQLRRRGRDTEAIRCGL